MELYDKIIEASQYIKNVFSEIPPQAIILGTGLGSLTDGLLNKTVIKYKDIPHFVSSTVKSHNGELICGSLKGTQVIVLKGRYHYYEGYSMQEVTFPIRVLERLGIKQLTITNASGSLNPDIKTGNIVLIKDHISLFGPNPLRGITDERLGERFPDMTKTYNSTLITKVKNIALESEIKIREGIYIYVQGPSLETPAEHKLLRMAGADVVGMSTVPEVIVARQCGVEVCVLSCVTNECLSEEGPKETSLEEVITAAELAAPKLLKLISQLVATA